MLQEMMSLELRDKLIARVSLYLPLFIIASTLVLYVLPWLVRLEKNAGFIKNIQDMDGFAIIGFMVFGVITVFTQVILGKSLGIYVVGAFYIAFILFLSFMIVILLRSPIKIFLAILLAFIPAVYLSLTSAKSFLYQISSLKSIFTLTLWGFTMGLPLVVTLLLITFIWKSENSQLKNSRIPLLSISLLPFIIGIIKHATLTIRGLL